VSRNRSLFWAKNVALNSSSYDGRLTNALVPSREADSCAMIPLAANSKKKGTANAVIKGLTMLQSTTNSSMNGSCTSKDYQ
jgi:hypothetical protein